MQDMTTGEFISYCIIFFLIGTIIGTHTIQTYSLPQPIKVYKEDIRRCEATLPRSQNCDLKAVIIKE